MKNSIILFVLLQLVMLLSCTSRTQIGMYFHKKATIESETTMDKTRIQDYTISLSCSNTEYQVDLYKHAGMWVANVCKNTIHNATPDQKTTLIFQLVVLPDADFSFPSVEALFEATPDVQQQYIDLVLPSESDSGGVFLRCKPKEENALKNSLLRKV